MGCGFKIGVLLALLASGVSDASVYFKPASHCEITIRETRTSGERRRMSFETPLRSRSECRELAQLHRNALFTKNLRVRKVSYSWGVPKVIGARTNIRYTRPKR